MPLFLCKALYLKHTLLISAIRVIITSKHFIYVTVELLQEQNKRKSKGETKGESKEEKQKENPNKTFLKKNCIDPLQKMRQFYLHFQH